MKTENMKTMRRKVIEEGRSERDAAKAASTQSESLSVLSSQLDDLQTQAELTSEVIEDKGNQVIDALNRVDQSIIDTTAGAELTAEASERTTEAVKQQTEVSNKISDKLSKLTELLNERLSAITTPNLPQTTVPDTSLSVVEDAVPVDIVTPGLPELLQELIPDPVNNNNNPNDEFFPTVPENPESDSKKGADEERKKKDSDTLSNLLKATKSGFKASMSITDRIAGMLFKYTVTAVIEAAKTAALLFSIVLGIDVIMKHFKYWSDKFTSDFDKFSAEAGEWGSTLASIFGTLENIQKFREAGDWSGLTVAIVKGVTEIIYNLSELISLGMSKVAAAILSLIPGLGDAALSVEGAALEGFQERTGNSLSKEDQDTLAKYQSSKIEKGENFFDKVSQGKTWIVNKITGDANISDFVTDEERESQNEKLRQMKPEEREQVLKKGNEARAAIVRFEKYMEQINPDDKRSVESADKAYANLQTQLNDTDLNNSPVTKKELSARMNIVTAKYDKLKGKEPQPAPSSQSEDVKKVESIEKNKAAKEASLGTSAGAAAANLFNTNNVINNSRTINTVSPVTSTNAPGVFGATGVN